MSEVKTFSKPFVNILSQTDENKTVKQPNSVLHLNANVSFLCSQVVLPPLPPPTTLPKTHFICQMTQHEVIKIPSFLKATNQQSQCDQTNVFSSPLSSLRFSPPSNPPSSPPPPV